MVNARAMIEESDDEESVGMEAESVAENTISCQYPNHFLIVPRQCSSHYGSTFVVRVLNADNAHCIENFRIDKQIFYKLCDILETKKLLSHRSGIRVEEQLAIFLFKMGNCQVNDIVVEELFRRSSDMISRLFSMVLHAIHELKNYVLGEPSGTSVPAEIVDNPELYPYFKDCIGMVEMAYIPTTVDVKIQERFRNKNGLISQKVMAACSFDFQFRYLLPGWEGSASNEVLLKSALFESEKPFRLHVPEGKYYLVEASGSTPSFLAPYRRVRQSFNENCQPQNAQELFNLRFSLLRNHTEHIIKALKERFPILEIASPFSTRTQRTIFFVACIIHNLIHRDKRNTPLLAAEEQVIQQQSLMQEEYQFPEFEASKLRDSIATTMWNDYKRDNILTAS